jgi:5'-nucleotidase/UDP-sugar diphosphatase
MRRLSIALIVLFLLARAGGWAPAAGAELRILHVNDFHGFAPPHQPPGSLEFLGGVAYLAGEVDRLRREKPTLLLAAGDMIQGSNWANLFKGRSSIALMNAMGFDAMVVGNHEFDFGLKVLRKRISQAAFPVLGANVLGFPPLKPYLIKSVGGLKLGIIGVVTDTTPGSTHPRNVVGLKFIPPAAAVKKYLNKVRENSDIVIVLSHQGLAADQALAAAVPGIDVIVGGHSHTRVLKPVMVGRTLIVQAGAHAEDLGVLDLTVQGGRVTASHGFLLAIKPAAGLADPKIQRLVADYTRRVDSLLNQTVGRTEVDLNGQTPDVRSRETNLGDLVADVLRAQAGADAAIINGGGLKASIARGPITAKQVHAVLPFDNYLVALRLSGRQVREVLEHGLSSLPRPAGRFPQVSGLTLVYSPAAPAGQRVREVTIAGRPLDPDREYLIATNDYLAAGGDGFKTFGAAFKAAGEDAGPGGARNGGRLAYNDSSRSVRDLVIDYLRARKVVAPQVEGRLQAVD